MVVKVVDVDRMTLFEPKRHPPTAGNGHSKVALQLALERMQSEARDIHSFRASTPVKGSKDAQQFRHVILRNFRR